MVEAKLADAVVPLNELAQTVADAAGVWGASIPLPSNYASMTSNPESPS
jgi:hypothetical protein